jgi:2-succinyl-5-enolpyruvyl-6-hydroxy-3-cyclohexene-1-carboxylate synthase
MMPVTAAATFCATLVDEWIRAGVRHAVVAPGSRSTPLALALTDRSEIATHVVIDERSASFTALGLGLATGLPAILLCTSGTAATHFHGAVVEARLSSVPMIVCTADRPPELRDVGAPQSIDQNRLYGSAVRWFIDPGVPDLAMSHAWRTMATRAFIEALDGPVHLNLPLREPLLGEAGPLPAARSLPSQYARPDRRLDFGSTLRHVLSGGVDVERAVIVAGAGADRFDGVHRVASERGWPVLADACSGVRMAAPTTIGAFDSILRVPEFASANRCELVIRLGRPPASKVLAQWLAAPGAVQVQLGGPGDYVDPDHTASYVGGPTATLLGSASPIRGDAAVQTRWLERWRSAEVAAQAVFAGLLHGPLGEAAVARVLTATLSPDQTLLVSSSMPIRDVEWYGAVRGGPRVLSNRGANGIDGVMSTAVGVALTGVATTVLLGDLAFLHDHGALVQLAGRGVDLTVVVVDNDGGGIFEFLPQRGGLDRARFEALYGTPHGADLLGLAAAHGIAGLDVTDAGVLAAELGRSGIRILRVRSERSANVAAHDALHEAVRVAVGRSMSQQPEVGRRG